MRNLVKIFAPLFLAFYLTLYFSLIANAFTAIPANPNTINPNRFTFEARPGETIKDELYIENSSPNKIAFEIYGVDETTNQKGDFALKAKFSEQKEMGAWINIQTPLVEIPANSYKVIDFSIKTPQDAKLQNYQGGIAVEKAQKSPKNGTLDVVTRIGVRIDLSLKDNPQPIEKLADKAPFWQRISKTSLGVALGLFLISAWHLASSYRKENRSNK